MRPERFHANFIPAAFSCADWERIDNTTPSLSELEKGLPGANALAGRSSAYNRYL
jgi:hypothetical protein